MLHFYWYLNFNDIAMYSKPDMLLLCIRDPSCCPKTISDLIVALGDMLFNYKETLLNLNLLYCYCTFSLVHLIYGYKLTPVSCSSFCVIWFVDYKKNTQ